MKIDFVLTAGNLNHHYLQIFPLIHQVWKKRFNLDCYLILVATEIPDYLIHLKDSIILFKPMENINDIYVAQVIRILYPALYPNKNILITDLDIIPVNKQYFIKPVKKLEQNFFVSYTDRYIKQEMLAICFNLAPGYVYSKMFNVLTLEDIKNKLIEWYNPDYTGRKNCPGWYTDQKQLYRHFYKYQGNKKILNDKIIGFKRLNNRTRDKQYIVKNFNDILNNIEKYSDIHCIKPFSKTKNYLRKIVKKLIT